MVEVDRDYPVTVIFIFTVSREREQQYFHLSVADIQMLGKCGGLKCLVVLQPRRGNGNSNLMGFG